MTITYGIVCETYMLGDDIRIAYGIAVFTDTEINGTVSIIKSVHDISPDKEKVEYLVRRCNQYGLSPEHLADVIEDFLEV